METHPPPREPQHDAGVPAPPGPRAPEVPAEAATYPLQASVEQQAEYNRFLPLVKGLLAFPHFFALLFFAIGALFVIAYSFFVVIFTQRYPGGAFDYVVGVQRWAWRLNAYLLLMTDRYPPFSRDDDPAYPARFEIAYPEKVDWWRPLVAWILAYPYLLAAGGLLIAAWVLVWLAFFSILFTKRYPDSFFRFVLVALRWQIRGGAYANWLVTRYPPWVWA
jgi:hypothetical protein